VAAGLSPVLAAALVPGALADTGTDGGVDGETSVQAGIPAWLATTASGEPEADGSVSLDEGAPAADRPASETDQGGSDDQAGSRAAAADQDSQKHPLDDSGGCAEGGCPDVGDLLAAQVGGGPPGGGQSGPGPRRNPAWDLIDRVVREEVHQERDERWEMDHPVDPSEQEAREEELQSDPWDPDESVVNKIDRIRYLLYTARLNRVAIRNVLRRIEGVADEVAPETREYRDLVSLKQSAQEQLRSPESWEYLSRPPGRGPGSAGEGSAFSGVELAPPLVSGQRPPPEVRPPAVLPGPGLDGRQPVTGTPPSGGTRQPVAGPGPFGRPASPRHRRPPEPGRSGRRWA
jgi:hypothetical protein